MLNIVYIKFFYKLFRGLAWLSIVISPGVFIIVGCGYFACFFALAGMMFLSLMFQLIAYIIKRIVVKNKTKDDKKENKIIKEDFDRFEKKNYVLTTLSKLSIFIISYSPFVLFFHLSELLNFLHYAIFREIFDFPFEVLKLLLLMLFLGICVGLLSVFRSKDEFHYVFKKALFKFIKVVCLVFVILIIISFLGFAYGF